MPLKSFNLPGYQNSFSLGNWTGTNMTVISQVHVLCDLVLMRYKPFTANLTVRTLTGKQHLSFYSWALILLYSKVAISWICSLERCLPYSSLLHFFGKLIWVLCKRRAELSFPSNMQHDPHPERNQSLSFPSEALKTVSVHLCKYGNWHIAPPPGQEAASRALSLQ